MVHLPLRTTRTNIAGAVLDIAVEIVQVLFDESSALVVPEQSEKSFLAV
jgi:hypothetical protein